MKKSNKQEPPAKMRKFRITAAYDFELSLAEDVIRQGCAPDDPIFGGKGNPKAVAEHIAYNMIVNQLTLSEIDGYANRHDSEAAATIELLTMNVEE